MASTRRKSAAIALAVIGIAGLSLASAAQLDVNSASLGAGAVEVASCDDAVDLTYTVSGMDVTKVTVNGVDAAAGSKCIGQSIGLMVEDVSAGAEQPVVAGTTSYIFTLTTPVAAEDLIDAAVIIH